MNDELEELAKKYPPDSDYPIAQRVSVFFHEPTLCRIQEYRERWKKEYGKEISFDTAVSCMIELAAEHAFR